MFSSYERHSCLSLHLLLLSVAVCLLLHGGPACGPLLSSSMPKVQFFLLVLFFGGDFFLNLVTCVPEPTVSYQNTSELM